MQFGLAFAAFIWPKAEVDPSPSVAPKRSATVSRGEAFQTVYKTVQNTVNGVPLHWTKTVELSLYREAHILASR